MARTTPGLGRTTTRAVSGLRLPSGRARRCLAAMFPIRLRGRRLGMISCRIRRGCEGCFAVAAAAVLNCLRLRTGSNGVCVLQGAGDAGDLPGAESRWVYVHSSQRWAALGEADSGWGDDAGCVCHAGSCGRVPDGLDLGVERLVAGDGSFGGPYELDGADRGSYHAGCAEYAQRLGAGDLLG
jgi:hypothetical protein